jgi:hypothetical protein
VLAETVTISADRTHDNSGELLEEDLDNAQTFIIEHPAYAALKAKQLRYWELVDVLSGSIPPQQRLHGEAMALMPRAA